MEYSRRVATAFLFTSSCLSLINGLPLRANVSFAAAQGTVAADLSLHPLLPLDQTPGPVWSGADWQHELPRQTPPDQLAQQNLIPDLQRIPQTPEPLPDPLPALPAPDELLDTDVPPVNPAAPAVGDTFVVTRFDVVGSTVFSEQELAAVTDPFTQRPLSFTELLDVRSAITQLYVDRGYVTSGAILPPQTFAEGGVVEIQVVERQLEAIEVTGTRRLQPGYITRRIATGADTPLNVDRLLERLQLLQLNPLIESITADLRAGLQPGTTRLVVTVVEADSFDVVYRFDNNRSPSVGTARHQFRLTEGNLLGIGDRLSVGYSSTEGSNEVEVDYEIPFNAYNGTLRFSGDFNNNQVIEAPFEVLDIDSISNSYRLTVRQPVVRTPMQELALGLSATHQSSQTRLGIADIGPFPLSPEADEDGRTRVSALRFFQEWTQQSNVHVLSLRSQFNVGLNFLDATVRDAGADSRFFSWQGQGQWVRSLAPDTLFLLRGSTQLAADPLLTLEQFGLGGQFTVRGYRQDQLLTDNGLQASAELRFPILRDPNNDLLLQLTPFIDVGYGWNNTGDNPDPNVLAGIGTGLLLNVGDRLTARMDWGIPLTSVDDDADTLQENGLYFSVELLLF